MSQFVETSTKTFTAGAALAQFRRVKKSAGKLAYAGASDKHIGTLEAATFADGDIASVRLRTAEGTRKMVAAGPISADATVYAAANGMIDATGTIICGMALEAATALNDVIEVLPQGNDDTVSTTGTTSETFTFDSDSSAAKVQIDTNSATGNFTAKIVPANLSGNIVLTLPAATGTFATLAGSETLTNKTLTAPVVGGGLTASGSASNDFSSSTGTFKTSSGANTLSGAVTVADATTPSVTLASGKTNTGFFQANGKTSGGIKVIPADASGYVVTVTNSAQTTAGTTLTIPDFASVADTFAFVTLAQTLVNKTLTAPTINLGKVAANNTPVAATGSAAGDAAAVGAQDVVTISSDGANKGVKLLTGVAGQRITVINTTSTACKLYPASGGTINGAGADAAMTLPASKAVLCVCVAADTWRAYDLTATAAA